MQTPVPHDRRWLVLAVIGIAQLMVVLDATIVNIALPSAQADLGFSDDDRQWVITAYALAFGSLLLLGGRIADLFGRKRTFIIGLLGFAARLGRRRRAQTLRLLVGARALQGAFAALLAPAALSLLTTTFTDPAERGKAFGDLRRDRRHGRRDRPAARRLLTESLDWRWYLYVNRRLRRCPPRRARCACCVTSRRPAAPRLDVRGASPPRPACSRSSSASRGPRPTAGATPSPRLPGRRRRAARRLRRLAAPAPRTRCCRCASSPTATAAARSWRSASPAPGMFGVFLFLTYYLQLTLGFSAFETGLAFLPMSFSIAHRRRRPDELLPRTGPAAARPGRDAARGARHAPAHPPRRPTAATPRTSCPR